MWLTQLIDEQSGRAAGGGGSSAAWDRRGLQKQRERGREGVGRYVAVCYSGMVLAARHPACINVCVSVCVSDTSIDVKRHAQVGFLHQVKSKLH